MDFAPVHSDLTERPKISLRSAGPQGAFRGTIDIGGDVKDTAENPVGRK